MFTEYLGYVPGYASPRELKLMEADLPYREITATKGEGPVTIWNVECQNKGMNIFQTLYMTNLLPKINTIKK